MSAPEKIDTHHKALSINLDESFFGSFAEIGAGQEVARWFLRVGGASGTVAKTISAYDKEVSDELYGPGTRYVSQQRLEAMLESEWQQLLTQLQATRGEKTRFFAFVDTISARNYSGTNECHGWVGARFQTKPGGAPNDVVLHINLQDSTNIAQQEAAGILGVNLLYAAAHLADSPEEFLRSLNEELGLSRIEMDYVSLKGPAFAKWDANTVHALLVTGGYAESVVFPADGVLLPPTDLLYKKAIVLAPGSFEMADPLHHNLVQTTLAQLPADEVKESKGAIGLFSLSVAPAVEDHPVASTEHLLLQIANLQKLGEGVLLFRARELYKMTAFVTRYTKFPIHFAVGLSVLIRAMQDSYNDLPGRTLEGMARLFSQNVRLTVQPMPVEALQERFRSWKSGGWEVQPKDGWISAEDLAPPPPLGHLYKYLLGSGFVIPMKRLGT